MGDYFLESTNKLQFKESISKIFMIQQARANTLVRERNAKNVTSADLRYEWGDNIGLDMGSDFLVIQKSKFRAAKRQDEFAPLLIPRRNNAAKSDSMKALRISSSCGNVLKA